MPHWRSGLDILKNRPQSGTSCTRCGWTCTGLWPSLGGLAKRWIETNVIFGEGDFYGELFKLRHDQVLFLYAWYEYCPQCEQWRYAEALRFEATGGGKTQFVAAIVALEFAGPREIAPRSPNIPISAASFEQADLCFGQLVTMFGGKDAEVTESPLRGMFAVYDTEIKPHGDGPGVIRRVAAVAGTNEGGLPSLLICDELHEWGDVGSNKARVHTVIGKSTTKRKMRNPDRGRGRILNISTAGFSREGSILGRMYDRAHRILDDPSVDPRFLVSIFEARPGLDMKNPEHRRIAATDASPGAGVIWDVADRVAEWGKIEDHEWMRYYANTWPEMNAESWMREHPLAWEECKGEWESSDANPWVLAVDMALNHDSVAVNRCEKLDDGRIAVTAKIWRADDYGGVIPHDEVWGYILETANGIGFRGVVYDPRFFEVPARMLENQKVKVIEYGQTTDLMAPACGQTYRMILDRTIVHNGDRLLARHVMNAVKMPVERGGFVLKKAKSSGKIDACIAMCMGVMVLHKTQKTRKPMFSHGDSRG